MENTEEVSAFAVYKKGIGAKLAKKQGDKRAKKGQNKKQSPKLKVQKTVVKKLQNGKDTGDDGKMSKQNRKMKPKVKTDASNVTDSQSPKSSEENLNKTTNGNPKKRQVKDKTEAPTVAKSQSPKTSEENLDKTTNGNPKKRKPKDKTEASNLAESQSLKSSEENNPKRKKKDDCIISPDGKTEKIVKKAKPKAGISEKAPKKNIALDEPSISVKIEPKSPAIVLRNSSLRDGMKILKWLLAPIGVETFFENFWEKAPCLVERNDPTYFNKLISFEMIDQMLINNHIEFTKNIDITSYKNGQRETLNPEGRAMPSEVWEHYSNGCSIRLLNPQTYLQGIFTMNTTLQEYFHCMVGSNSYLTPPNSQGFAPHYDDIEAFVLQIEGRKRWKLYNPRLKNEVLPRVSSENFSQDEIGKPILEKVLMPGDILYFPRGTIHQAFTEPGFHSLHITLSVYQKQSYADLMEKLFPMILERAIAENVEFRRGLPLSVWHNAGIVYSDVETEEREAFLNTCRSLIAKAVADVPIDQAVDAVAKKYQHEALPPEITTEEKRRTVFGSKNTVDSAGQWQTDCEINPMTKVRLLRANILRLVEEEEKIRIYYYVDNSKEYCEFEPNYIEIEREDASSVEVLLKSYPEYVAVNELPLEDDEERKMGIVQLLWDRGLLMFDKPFN